MVWYSGVRFRKAKFGDPQENFPGEGIEVEVMIPNERVFLAWR